MLGTRIKITANELSAGCHTVPLLQGCRFRASLEHQHDGHSPRTHPFPLRAHGSSVVILPPSLQNERVLSAPLAAAILSAAIWLYLRLAHGSFWRLHPFDDNTATHTPPAAWPKVTVIVPARNEAETIVHAITSLLQQNYPAGYSLILVDDHSQDNTATLARQAATRVNAANRLTILSATSLPQGWTGKLWALRQGTALTVPQTSDVFGASATERILPSSLKANKLSPRAKRGTCFSDRLGHQANVPDYLWFTDADITHAPDTLTRLVSRAEKDHLDLTSLMVLLHAETFAERFTIPAFLFFFLKLYPPKWIADPKARTAGAAGGCILLRTRALERIGGLESIRQEVIDDCALAQAVKRTGGKIWMGLTRQSVSLRRYNSFTEIRDMIARTAFTQLRYSTLLLTGTLIGLAATYLAPIAFLFARETATRIVALATWLTMSLLFLPTVRYYRLNPVWAALLPATAAFYAYATFLSAIRHYANRGAQWKGRSQAGAARSR
jgi:glycosyltransferase involved in cell wall biosynthesis